VVNKVKIETLHGNVSSNLQVLWLSMPLPRNPSV